MKNKLISIIGTNASGKSALGIKLAKHFGGEIVSADSRQIYKYLDLGTGKVTDDEMNGVPHHLLDILTPGKEFSLARFQELAYMAIDDIIFRGRLPFLVGGTGLYTRAVTEGYNLSGALPDPERRKELESKTKEQLISILSSFAPFIPTPSTSKRQLIRKIEKAQDGDFGERASCPKYEVLQLGLTHERQELYSRIDKRLDDRISAGMIEEVKNVMEMGVSGEFLEGLGLEYRYTYRYLTGRYESFEAYRNELFREIRHFAKRQQTWFKKEKNIIWLDPKLDCFSDAASYIENFIQEDKS